MGVIHRFSTAVVEPLPPAGADWLAEEDGASRFDPRCLLKGLNQSKSWRHARLPGDSIRRRAFG
jgi:hypothetical protein